MIKRSKPEITEGKCDSCKGDLKHVEHWYENGDKTRPMQTTVAWEFAAIRPEFGYYSRTLDEVGYWVPEFHLCEGCFLKMIRFMGIDLPPEFADAPEKFLRLKAADELSTEAQKLGLYDPKKEKPA